MGHVSLTLASLPVRIVVAGFLFAMMFAMGIELGAEPRKDKVAKRRSRRLLVRGLLANLFVLPVLTYALVRLAHAEGAVPVALLLAASTPGGRFAPRVAMIARAELSLAVEVVIFLAKLTPFVAPVAMKLLLGVPRPELRDLVLIAQLLVVQLLPYFAGRWLRRTHPSAAARLARVALSVEIALAVIIFLLLVLRGELADLRVFGLRGLAIAVAFAFLTIAVGWVFGGRSPAVRRALAVTASARNLALGVVIAGELFPGGAVQLALFGIWFTCAVVGVGFALSVRGLGRPLVAQPA